MSLRTLRGEVRKPAQVKVNVDESIKQRFESIARNAGAGNSYFFTRLVEHAEQEFGGATAPEWWTVATRDQEALIDPD